MCTGSDRDFIVVGIDDRPESSNAATYAIAHARAFGLGVRLVHAYGSLVGYGQYGAINLGRLERTARALIGTVADRLDVPEGVCVERSVDSRSPVDALTGAGDDARYVVIGRRDKHWAPRLMRANVASRLSGKASVPVITVPASWEQSDRRHRPVIIGVDGGSRSRHPLAFAFAHAHQLRTGLTVLHAVPHESGSGADDHDPAAISGPLARWRAQYPDVAVDVRSARGDTDEVLTEWSADASLLVIGKQHEYPEMGTRLGPLGSTLLTQALCPVAVVPQALADTRGAVDRADRTVASFDTGARS